MDREIYLDNSATTKPYDEVIEYMGLVGSSFYGNPSSLHTKGLESEKLIKKARETIAQSLGANSREIYFTSGGTESNNLAIRGYLEANPRKGKHIITSSIEHPSVLEVFRQLEGAGYKVDYIGVDEKGIINIEELKSRIGSETALISIMYVNNETGAIQPVEEAAAARNLINPQAVLHVDAVQAYGKFGILPGRSGIDMLTASSHKIHGPKGVGALYVSSARKIKPIIYGGGQESLIRSGTENVPGICGFGLAVEKTFKNIDDSFRNASSMKKLLIKHLMEEFDDVKLVSPEKSSPYILNVAFKHLKAEVLLHHLAERNIYISAGSACSSRKNIHSHVLREMGLAREELDGAVRISFSTFNREDDVEDLVEALKQIVPKIRIKRGGRK